MRRVGSWADISSDGKYRYSLTRRWSIFDEPDVVFCMLNPSTADGDKDDPTIRRCIKFAMREGAGGIEVVNLMAYRATDPNKALLQPDSCGPENDNYLKGVAKRGWIVCAWGVLAPNDLVIRALKCFETVFGIKLLCLGVTKDGHPRHPLYVSANQPLVLWHLPVALRYLEER